MVQLIKRKCPVCGEEDSEFHGRLVTGDRIVILSLMKNESICLSCGYDRSQCLLSPETKWIYGGEGCWIKIYKK